MRRSRYAVLLLTIVTAAALVVGAAPEAVANAPVVQHRVLGFLAYLPADYQGISVADLRARVDAGSAPFILDVREPEEFSTGYIRGAINVPIRTVPAHLNLLPTSRSAEIVTVCPSGFRSAMVTMALSVLGYTNVKTMTLGMREWNSRGYPTIKAP